MKVRLATLAVAAVMAGPAAAPVFAEPTGSVLTDQVAAPEDLIISDTEREAATDAADGGLAGIIVPTLAYGYFRALVDSASEGLEDLGLTVEVCEARTASGLDATDCLDDLVARDARVIIATTISPEALETASQAIADGTVIVQVNIANLSEAGAPRVAVADTTEALAGVAAQTAANLWGDAPVGAVILGDPDIPSFADLATALEEALATQAPQLDVTRHMPGRLPLWAGASVDDALLSEDPPDLVIGLVEFGIVSASADHPEVAFVSGGCSPAAVTAMEAGGSFKGCARSSFPDETGAIAADLATRLLAGGEAPGSVLIPVTTLLQDPMTALDGSAASAPRTDDPRVAGCASRLAWLPDELDGERLSVELIDGHQAVESGELPPDTLVRLHLASGTGLSEDAICLIRFAYGDDHAAHGTLWNLDGDFVCGEDDLPSECQVDRYIGGFTERSIPGAKVRTSRPMVADQRVTVIRLPRVDLFATRVGPDMPAREIVVARVGDTYATFASREAAELILPVLPDPVQ
jgi:ABC-type sugar transport system substrate-binding protein